MVRLFIKPYCGWCHKAIRWLDDHDVEYKTIDVIADEAAFEEMIRLSGQDLAPVIDVNGEILADFGPEACVFWRNSRMRPTQPSDPAKRPRLPEWLRLPLPTSDTFGKTRALLDELKLHTVCESARCPNHWECWSKGTATFMIAGDRCTRACGFCAVNTAKPFALEADEPARVAEASRRMGLKHVVITAVARDDLPDGGAQHFGHTIEAVRALNPGIIIEVLTPDFNDDDDSIEAVLAAHPHIFNHNLETVRRLTPSVRSRATYDRSLRTEEGQRKIRWKSAHEVRPDAWFGRNRKRNFRSDDGLSSAQCDILTLGQYLQPTLKHLPVVEFVSPQKFDEYGERRAAWDLSMWRAAPWSEVPIMPTFRRGLNKKLSGERLLGFS